MYLAVISWNSNNIDWITKKAWLNLIEILQAKFSLSQQNKTKLMIKSWKTLPYGNLITFYPMFVKVEIKSKLQICEIQW